MNKLMFSFIACALFLSACDNNKNSVEKTSSSQDTAAKAKEDEKKVKEAAADLGDVKEELAKLSPISGDELKKLLPQTLIGSNQENGGVENSSGVNIASADYKLNDSMSLTLSIIDCAGPAGVGIYTTQHLGMAAAEGETEEEYTKAITINGDKGFENCTKEDNECALVWFTANRYLVSLEGASAAELKKIAGELKIK